MDLSSITGLAHDALKANATVWFFEQVRDFVRVKVASLARDKEREFNQKLAQIRPGDEFLGRMVVDVDADSVLLPLQFTDISVFKLRPNEDSQDFEPFKAPTGGVKIDLARGVVRIGKLVNFTDGTRPPIKVLRLESYAVQVSVNRENYNLSFGGGEDHLAGFRQFDVAVRWDKPQLRLFGFYADSDTGGFIIYLHVNWPWPIPLANSGLALIGVGLTYGERFAPKLSEIVNSDPLEEMRKANAAAYVAWARKPPLKQWIPVNSDVRVFGLDTDIGDLSSAGKILRFEQAGISYVSYGPVIILGGKLYIFDKIKLGDTIGAIDVRSASIYLSSTFGFDLLSGLSMSGSVAMSASAHDQSRTFIEIGGSSLDGARVSILGFLVLKGGARLVPLQGFSGRASARLSGSGELLGFGGGFDFWLDQIGNLGWNPVELGGQLTVGGSVWVKIIGVRVGVGIAASLGIQLPEPLKLYLRAVATLDLPWPLGSIDFPFTIFDRSVDTIAAALQPLKALTNQPLPYFYWASGITGALSADSGLLLPDVSFDIPFHRIPRSALRSSIGIQRMVDT